MNDKIKRILAAIIDFYSICFLSSVVIFILTSGKFSITSFSITVYLILSFLLLLIKDFVFKNASIGKRIFKIEITKNDETQVTIVDTIKRNIPILVLLPIEVLLLMINNKRIGDVWTKTTIVYNGFDKTKRKPHPPKS